MPLLLQTLSKLDWDSRAAGMELAMWSNLCWWGEMTCWMVGSFNSILTLIQGCCMQIVLRGLKKPWSYLGVFCCLQWDRLGVEKERCFCGVGWLNASRYSYPSPWYEWWPLLWTQPSMPGNHSSLPKCDLLWTLPYAREINNACTKSYSKGLFHIGCLLSMALNCFARVSLSWRGVLSTFFLWCNFRY